jgi:ATP-binding cassette subfamily A (ABC1) protein 3
MVQFFRLLLRNFQIWRRDGYCVALQLLTTILFASYLILIKFLSKKSDVVIPETFYLKVKALEVKVPLNQTSATLTLDKYLMRYSRMALSSSMMKQCTRVVSTNKTATVTNGKAGFIAIVSAHDEMYSYLARFFDMTSFRYRRFNSTDDLDSYIKLDSYGTLYSEGALEKVCLGISFSETTRGAWTYSLHFNTTGSSRVDILDTKNKQTMPFLHEETPTVSNHRKYFTSGALTLQSLIDNLIMRIDTKSTSAQINARFIRSPTPSYTSGGLFTTSGDGDIDVFIIIPSLTIFLSLVYHIIVEKESMITSNLCNMGMSITQHYLSWYVFYQIVLAVIGIIWAALIKLFVYQKCHFAMLYLLFLLPGLVLVSIGQILARFMNTTKNALIISLLVFTAMYAVSISLRMVDDPTPKMNMYYGLSPITSTSLAGKILTMKESLTKEGLGWADFGVMVEGYKFKWFAYCTAIEYLSLNVLVLIILAFSNIRFNCRWACRRKAKTNGAQEIETIDMKSSVNKKLKESTKVNIDGDFFNNFEEENFLRGESSADEVVRLQNLRKVYPNGKVALKNLSASFVKGELMCVLGHNGAGKTTTIGILSGNLSQTSGSLSVCGFDRESESQKIAKIMGICPQISPLYPTLTCFEQLDLTLFIKNPKLSAEARKSEIMKLLSDLDLTEKCHKYTKTLSGGQKRKLSLSVSLIGGSKVVLLDEPTAGMDAVARRKVWDLLKEYKKDRIILLSTHLLDEAEYLGDKFAILREGNLVACGSALYLKQHFGAGYDLTVLMERGSKKANSIGQLIAERFPDAEMLGVASNEVKFRLPLSDANQYESLFQQFEQNQQELQIQSFGVSLTTLEEVFHTISQIPISDLSSKKEFSEYFRGSRLSVNDGRTRIYTLRSPRDPAGSVLNSEVQYSLKDIQEKGCCNRTLNHLSAMLRKRLRYALRDYRALFCELFLPLFVITIGFMSSFLTTYKDSPEIQWTLSTFYTSSSPALFALSSIIPISPILNSLETLISSESFQPVGKSEPKNNTFDFERKLMEIDENPVVGYYVESINAPRRQFNYSLFYNTTFYPATIVGANQINNAFYKMALNDSQASIKIFSSPLKIPKYYKRSDSGNDTLVAVILFSVALSLFPAGIIVFIVKEKETGAKHLQLLSGVGQAVYWGTNLLFDLSKYALLEAYILSVVYIFNIEGFKESSIFTGLAILLSIYGPVIIIFTYCTSFMFKDAETAQIATFVINLNSSVVFILLTMSFRRNEGVRDVGLYFPELLFKLLPSYDVMFGIYSSSIRDAWQRLFKLAEVPLLWSRWGILIETIALILMFCFYPVLLAILEKRGSDRDGKRESNKANRYRDEQAKNPAIEYNNTVLSVQNMFKYYYINSSSISGYCNCIKKQKQSNKLNKVTALSNVSFDVQAGSCFGLLGANGAGKTTTFKILTGSLIPSRGDAFLSGVSMVEHFTKVRSSLGYCPQFDCLLDKLTGREHLELYSQIKNIDTKLRRSLIDKKLKELALLPFADVLIENYSGGNKRKLSLAIALLGNPSLILLDEPSSGVDPDARKDMWRAISANSSLNADSAIVLTTHSMEEAEALCTRLAILVKGVKQCDGSVQEIKSAYGQGFILEVKISSEPSQEQEFIKHTLQSKCRSEGISRAQVIDVLNTLELNCLVKELEELDKPGSPVSLTSPQDNKDNLIFSQCYQQIPDKNEKDLKDTNIQKQHSLIKSENNLIGNSKIDANIKSDLQSSPENYAEPEDWAKMDLNLQNFNRSSKTKSLINRNSLIPLIKRGEQGSTPQISASQSPSLKADSSKVQKANLPTLQNPGEAMSDGLPNRGKPETEVHQISFKNLEKDLPTQQISEVAREVSSNLIISCIEEKLYRRSCS